MLSLRSLFCSALLVARIAPSLADNAAPQPDSAVFQQLLEQADPPALHAALHDLSPDKFAHGAYHADKFAAEAIHRDDPALASSIVVVAKRQADNSTGTVTSSSVTDTSTVVVPPGPPSTVIVTSTSTTPVPPVSTPVTTSSSVGSTFSTVPIPTTSSPQQSFSTPPSGSPTSSQAGTEGSTTAGPTQTSGQQTGSESGSGSSRHTSLVLQTVTAPDGSAQTITSFTIIDGAAATQSRSPSGTTTGPSGSLQSQGLAPRSRSLGWEAVGVFGGAVGFAFLM